MKILITGASGVLGRAVAARLAASLELDITLLSRTRSFCPDTILMDLRDAAALSHFPTDFDCIVHLAAVIPAVESEADRETGFEDNVRSSLNIFEFAARNKIPRIIYGSSCSVYGEFRHAGAIDELAPLKPDNFYALSKLAGEQLLNAYQFHYGIQTVSLRFSYIYGMGMRQNTAVHGFLRCAKDGGPITVFNEGSDSLDLIYAKDAASAIFCALTSGDGIYNIGAGRSSTVRELADAAIHAARSASEIKSAAVSRPSRSGCMSIQRAAKDLNWSPQFDLQGGILDFASQLYSERNS